MFLLLSVLDLIGTGLINRNFIEPNLELTETFNRYLALLPDFDRWVSIANPFYRLESDGFWSLKVRPGISIPPGKTTNSLKQLRDCCYGASFNDDLFPLLKMKTSREKLRAVLVETYFSPDLQRSVR